MITRNKIIIGMGVVIAITISFLLFYTLSRTPIESTPVELLFICNNDVKKHTITVEAFDSNNISISNETYDLGPNENKHSSVLNERGGVYTFKITLDDEITEAHRMNLSPGETIYLSLYSSASEEIIWVGIIVE